MRDVRAATVEKVVFAEAWPQWPLKRSTVHCLAVVKRGALRALIAAGDTRLARSKHATARNRLGRALHDED